MKAHELITKLTTLQERYGNKEVLYETDIHDYTIETVRRLFLKDKKGNIVLDCFLITYEDNHE